LVMPPKRLLEFPAHICVLQMASFFFRSSFWGGGRIRPPQAPQNIQSSLHFGQLRMPGRFGYAAEAATRTRYKKP